MSQPEHENIRTTRAKLLPNLYAHCTSFSLLTCSLLCIEYFLLALSHGSFFISAGLHIPGLESQNFFCTFARFFDFRSSSLLLYLEPSNISQVDWTYYATWSLCKRFCSSWWSSSAFFRARFAASSRFAPNSVGSCNTHRTEFGAILNSVLTEGAREAIL